MRQQLGQRRLCIAADRHVHLDHLVELRRVDVDVDELSIAAKHVRLADDAVIESLRLEAGTPLYGVDISVENLPQEIARDTQAINFKKGCYLGQETVARIDALGHVNKLLLLVKFPASAAIPVGTELLAGDKVVGRVTSAAWSPQHQAMLALGYVRRELAKRGTRVESSAGPGEIVTIG